MTLSVHFYHDTKGFEALDSPALTLLPLNATRMDPWLVWLLIGMAGGECGRRSARLSLPRLARARTSRRRCAACGRGGDNPRHRPSAFASPVQGMVHLVSKNWLTIQAIEKPVLAAPA